jgi:DNA-binding GntR family transcriptional regulator
MAAQKKSVPKHVELREKLRSRFQRMNPNTLIPSAIKTTANDLAIVESLNISVGDEVYKIERVRFADKIPMAL